MARLPFDPERIVPPAPPEAPAPAHEVAEGAPAPAGGRGSRRRSAAVPLTVSQVAQLIKDVLAEHVPATLRVVGEISNLSNRTHCFFSLKDAGATISCVMFASAVRKVGFPLRDGMQVVATGRLDYYDAQGRLQLYVDRMEPVGQGALELQLRALIEELRQLGYFDPERKKPLPVLPRKVAVVTSRTGAALRDVINTAGRRFAGCQLVLVDVHVQGAAAAPEVAAAIEALSKHGLAQGIDAIILTRGGGSIEDLWAFNERVVADAIFRCTLPIVAAIGHETDTTVAELVADVRSATPTQAAMTLIPDAAALLDQLRQMGQWLTILARRLVIHERQRLAGLERQPMFRVPAGIYEPHRQRVEQLAQLLHTGPPRLLRGATERLETLGPRLTSSLPRRLVADGRHIEALERQLRSIHPANVLQRGYTYTLGPDGRVLRSVHGTKTGEAITTVLSDGRLRSVVEGPGAAAVGSAVPDASLPAPAGPSLIPSVSRAVAPSRPRRKGKTGDDDPGLFST